MKASTSGRKRWNLQPTRLTNHFDLGLPAFVRRYSLHGGLGLGSLLIDFCLVVHKEQSAGGVCARVCGR